MFTEPLVGLPHHGEVFDAEGGNALEADSFGHAASLAAAISAALRMCDSCDVRSRSSPVSRVQNHVRMPRRGFRMTLKVTR